MQKDPRVIIINGTGRSGKDTFVSFIRKHVETTKELYNKTAILNISTVDIVKDVAHIFGWNGEKDEKSRKFLSDLKDLTTEYNNHPKNYVKDYVFAYSNVEKDIIIFVHSREPEEIDWFKTNIKNCSTLLIKNSNVQIIQSNHADANVENYEYDYVIDNSGTLEDLSLKASYFLKAIV